MRLHGSHMINTGAALCPASVRLSWGIFAVRLDPAESVCHPSAVEPYVIPILLLVEAAQGKPEHGA